MGTPHAYREQQIGRGFLTCRDRRRSAEAESVVWKFYMLWLWVTCEVQHSVNVSTGVLKSCEGSLVSADEFVSFVICR